MNWRMWIGIIIAAMVGIGAYVARIVNRRRRWLGSAATRVFRHGHGRS